MVMRDGNRSGWPGPSQMLEHRNLAVICKCREQCLLSGQGYILTSTVYYQRCFLKLLYCCWRCVKCKPFLLSKKSSLCNSPTFWDAKTPVPVGQIVITLPLVRIKPRISQTLFRFGKGEHPEKWTMKMCAVPAEHGEISLP